METDLSIVIVTYNLNRDYLQQMLEASLFEHYPSSEYIICISNHVGGPVKNYLNSIQPYYNLKVVTLTSSEYRLECSYKEAINYCTKDNILFFPHEHFYLKSKITGLEELPEKFFIILSGENFKDSEVFFTPRDLFMQVNIPLVQNFKSIFIQNLKKESIPVYTHETNMYSFKGTEDIKQTKEKTGLVKLKKDKVPIRNTSFKNIQVYHKENILVISTDPYPVEDEYCPKKYLDLSKKTTAPGIRAWSMINYLHNKNKNVTLGCTTFSHFVPKKKYKFPIINIEKTDLNKYKYVITQTGHSVFNKVLSNFRNILILDCWIPSIVEYPYSVNFAPNRTPAWKLLSTELLMKAEYFIYPHERTLGLIIGSSIKSPKITISDINTQKRYINIPYCAPVAYSFNYMKKKRSLFFRKYQNLKGRVIFGWFGGTYPWFDFDNALKYLRYISEEYKDKCACVLKSLKHPVYSNLNKRVKHTKNPNFIIDPNWIDQKDKVDYITDIDYFIIFGKGIEQVFANRTRILDLCSNNRIVITNKNDNVGQVAAKYGLAYLVDPSNDKEVKEIIDYLVKNRQKVLDKRNILGFREEYSYEKHYKKLLDIL